MAKGSGDEDIIKVNQSMLSKTEVIYIWDAATGEVVQTISGLGEYASVESKWK